MALEISVRALLRKTLILLKDTQQKTTSVLSKTTTLMWRRKKRKRNRRMIFLVEVKATQTKTITKIGERAGKNYQ